jgi:hypothetical protein
MIILLKKVVDLNTIEYEICCQVGLEVLTSVVVRSSVFRDIVLCSPVKVNQHFRGTSLPSSEL